MQRLSVLLETSLAEGPVEIKETRAVEPYGPLATLERVRLCLENGILVYDPGMRSAGWIAEGNKAPHAEPSHRPNVLER